MSRVPQNYGSFSTSTPPDVNFIANRSAEFNAICDNVVTNIYTINSSVRGLDSAMKQIGTDKDTHALRNKIHVMHVSSNEIAAVTSKEIQKLKSLKLKGDKQQQLQVEKLEENFKEAIGRYTAVQSEIASKQKAHLLVTVSIENEGNDEETAAANETKQKVLAKKLAFKQEMLMERENRIRQIESDMLNVNDIMRTLGTLVHEQGATVDLIENSIDYAVGNVEEGAQQLIKASEYQRSRRWKLVYLVLILFVITSIVIILIVLSSHK